MSLFQRFYPDACEDTVYEIDFESWYAAGYRGVMFDVDNTLVPHGADATPQSVAFFRQLHEMGYETCLISNNKEERVRRFADPVGSRYLFKAGKPSRTGYRRAMDLMGTTPENTLFVGDQLFTDVYGARRTGVYSILVKPIHPKEEIQIVLKRYLEKVVLFFYHREVAKNAGK